MLIVNSFGAGHSSSNFSEEGIRDREKTKSERKK